MVAREFDHIPCPVTGQVPGNIQPSRDIFLIEAKYVLKNESSKHIVAFFLHEWQAFSQIRNIFCLDKPLQLTVARKLNISLLARRK